jgi:hypothetical protein
MSTVHEVLTMKKLSLLLIMLFTAPLFAADALQEVAAAENARVAAFVSKDTAALDKLLRDDLTYVHASGRVDNKKSLIEAIRSDQLHYTSFTKKAMNVRLAGDTAVLDGEYAVKVINRGANPENLDLNVFFLAVYVHSPSGWQLMAWQTTRDIRPEKP